MEIARTTELPGKGKEVRMFVADRGRTWDVRVCIKIYAGINAYGFRYRKEGKQADGLQPCKTIAIAITVSYRPFLSENHPCVGMRRSLPEGLTLFPFFLNFWAQESMEVRTS